MGIFIASWLLFHSVVIWFLWTLASWSSEKRAAKFLQPEMEGLLNQLFERLDKLFGSENLTAADFIETHDLCYRLCSAECEQVVYDRLVSFLRQKAAIIKKEAAFMERAKKVLNPLGYMYQHWIKQGQRKLAWGESLLHATFLKAHEEKGRWAVANLEEASSSSH